MLIKIEIALFLLFSILPLAFVLTMYKSYNSKMYNFYKRMCGLYNSEYYKHSMKMLLCFSLTILLVGFHINYFAVFPRDWGIMISTMLLGLFFLPTRTYNILMRIRNDNRMFLTISILSAAMIFIPHLLPTAICGVYVMNFASLLPADGSEDFFCDHIEDKDLQVKFTDFYFH